MARVEIAGRGQDSHTPIGAVFSEQGIIMPPYDDLVSYGLTDVPAVNKAIYTPSASFRFIPQLVVMSCEGAQIFTFTCGGWHMTIYISGQSGGTEVVPFVGGGLRLARLPLLLTTPNAVNHYVGFMGRQVAE